MPAVRSREPEANATDAPAHDLVDPAVLRIDCRNATRALRNAVHTRNPLHVGWGARHRRSCHMTRGLDAAEDGAPF
jgi:hypothetical protein